MRILTFTSLFPNFADPDYGIFVYQRAAHLAGLPGNQVVAVSPVPYFPRWLKTRRWKTASILPQTERIGDISVHHPRYFLLPKISMPVHAFAMFVGSLRCCKTLHAQRRFDCIDAHFVYPDGLAALLVGRVLGIPVVVSARGTDINLYPSFPLIRPMIAWTLRKCAVAIAVSAALKEQMIAVGGDPDNIHVVPNGVDAARFHPFSQQEARARLQLPAEGPLLVAVGALVPVKNHELLLRSMHLLAERHSELRLYVLGDGPLRKHLENLTRELGLRDRVKILGKRPNDELATWFSAADLSCLPSQREGWPNVVTESLACGTPVVATRVGGVPEILHSADLGIIVEGTAESMASGIEQGLQKSWNREEISRVTHRRTWRTVACEVEAILERPVQQANAGHRANSG